MPTMMIARACELPKSSAHNLLNTLRAAGFVSYYPNDHAWGLGPAVLEVGSAFVRSGTLVRLAQPRLRALAATQGVSAQLWLPFGDEVMCVEQVLPDIRAVVSVRETTRLPTGGCAAGRSILAALPGVQALRTGLLDEGSSAEQIRATGYAVDTDVAGPGIRAVAAAVVARDGLPLASVCAMSVASADVSVVVRLGAAVAACARELSGFFAAGVGLVSDGHTLLPESG